MFFLYFKNKIVEVVQYWMYWAASGLEQKSQCEMAWCRFDVYTYQVTIEAHSLPKPC